MRGMGILILVLAGYAAVTWFFAVFFVRKRLPV